MANGPRAVLVTGASGNLGGQLVKRLQSLDWCETIYCLDPRPVSAEAMAGGKLVPVVADLADPTDRTWQEAMAAADAVAHFAVVNPAPNGDWAQSIAAIDMTANLLQHAKPEGCRFLYASSNHTMGQYKDVDWGKLGKLDSSTPPLPGTRYFSGGAYHQPNMYGASKVVGERLLRAKAMASDGRFTAVSLRIGWCLSGNDDPNRINAKGGGGGGAGMAEQPAEEAARDLKWFRNMWLSHRDFADQFEAALTADASGWPAPAIIVNAVSGNRGTLWDMSEAKKWLGHVPHDDVWTRLGIEPD